MALALGSNLYTHNRISTETIGSSRIVEGRTHNNTKTRTLTPTRTRHKNSPQDGLSTSRRKERPTGITKNKVVAPGQSLRPKRLRRRPARLLPPPPRPPCTRAQTRTPSLETTYPLRRMATMCTTESPLRGRTRRRRRGRRSRRRERRGGERSAATTAGRASSSTEKRRRRPALSARTPRTPASASKACASTTFSPKRSGSSRRTLSWAS
mmetsp:Transcript_25351/g.45052  ORF Transcript_25351/g.45052 Transcript_25351/m.45052 type:complete len:210 (+) Transcript_25351:609-1238(+)